MYAVAVLELSASLGAGGRFAADAAAWWLFAGKLHPVVVHFPIGLLVAAAVLEFFRLRRGERRPGQAAMACLLIGAPAAVVAAAAGWSNALTAGHQGNTAWVLETHRWLGVATACVAIAALVLAALARVMGGRSGGGTRLLAWYRFGLVASAALVAVAGHYGGSLIYGTDYLQKAWQEARGGRPVGGIAAAPAGHVGPVDFTRDVMPVLARRCLQCHAGTAPEARLSLESLAGALKGGKSGRPALVPGKPAESELMKLVTGADPERRMPPKGGPLEPAQIAMLESWIAQGAPWGGNESGRHWHWAYRPPVRPNTPAVNDTYWARNAIDPFVLAKLEAAGLKPAPEADRAMLLRRVTLDLTGLPPSPSEVEAFLADPAPDAYERVVNRLLDSPAYGERMAMKWLDLARYADTHGYEKDDRRTMWPYRDWVIDAFNRDVPFDRFTVEQLAGDLLPEPTTEQLVATGFNRNTQINEEGGVDAEEFRVDAVIDRVNTVGSVWLGTTVGCAQCHNHKNDPISQEEYFRLFACFNNDDADVTLHSTGASAAGGMLPISRRDDREEFGRLQARVADLQKSLAEYPEERLAAAQARWERDQGRKQPAWTVLQPLKVTSAAGATFTSQPDGSVLASGASADKDTYTVEATLGLSGATALKLEVFPDPSLPGKGVGRSAHGNIVLQDLKVAVAIGPAQEFKDVAVPQAAADHEQGLGTADAWPIAAAVDGDQRSGWAIGPKVREAHTAVFRFGTPLGKGGGESSGTGATLRITMAQNYGGYHTIGRFRLSATNDPDPLGAAPVLPEIGAILGAKERTSEESVRLAAYFKSVAPELRPLRDELATSRKRLAELTVAKAMVMKRAATPRETHVLERGSFLSPGKKVEPGVPAALGSPKVQPRDRLELAAWLVSADNPLTARVTVNRLWELHFGRGIVETSEDFGSQGDLPTHPELLDYLATELVRQGWSLKAMHRLIVTSATYRQASIVSPELLEKDPFNKLLARGPRFRVDAETVRDTALAASGLLSAKVGGPSVFPPQPDGVWTMIYSNDTWKGSTGEDRYRRGLYTFWRRTAPYPMFTAFDATSREVACTRRARTNTPLQALTTLNDPQFVEAAVGLARRLLTEGGKTDEARVELGFLLCVSRRPTPAEAARVLELVRQERSQYAADAAAARALLASAPGVKTEGLDTAELAAWSVAGNVLLNLDEALTRP